MSTDLDNALSLIKEIAKDRKHPDFYKVGNEIMKITQVLGHQAEQTLLDKDRYEVVTIMDMNFEIYENELDKTYASDDDHIYAYDFFLRDHTNTIVERRLIHHEKLNTSEMNGKTIRIYDGDQFIIEN